uniref:uncharacterized protein LOC120325423 n=1 Tax=Styela clava TaxID=7725 RepID=UPI001939A59A|nr:uncharacterized protein LOC120325423 [Styela clava]
MIMWSTMILVANAQNDTDIRICHTSTSATSLLVKGREGTCYHLAKEKASYEEAMRFCTSLGGNIADIPQDKYLRRSKLEGERLYWTYSKTGVGQDISNKLTAPNKKCNALYKTSFKFAPHLTNCKKNLSYICTTNAAYAGQTSKIYWDTKTHCMKSHKLSLLSPKTLKDVEATVEYLREKWESSSNHLPCTVWIGLTWRNNISAWNHGIYKELLADVKDLPFKIIPETPVDAKQDQRYHAIMKFDGFNFIATWERKDAKADYICGNLPALAQGPPGMNGETNPEPPKTKIQQYWNIILPLVGIITLFLIILTTVFLRKNKKRHGCLLSNSSQAGSDQSHSNPTFQMETHGKKRSSSPYISNADIASIPNLPTQQNFQNELPVSIPSKSQQLETVRIFNQWPRGTAPHIPFPNIKMGKNTETTKINRQVSTVSGPYETPMEFETPKGYLTFEVCSGLQVKRSSSDESVIMTHNLYLQKSTIDERKLTRSKQKSSTYTTMNMMNKITPQRHHPYHQIEENMQGKRKIKFSELRSSKSYSNISIKGPVTQRQLSDPAKHVYEQMKIRSLSNRAAGMTTVATTKEALLEILEKQKRKTENIYQTENDILEKISTPAILSYKEDTDSDAKIKHNATS